MEVEAGAGRVSADEELERADSDLFLQKITIHRLHFAFVEELGRRRIGEQANGDFEARREELAEGKSGVVVLRED